MNRTRQISLDLSNQGEWNGVSEPPFRSPPPIRVFGFNVKGKELKDWAPMTDALS